MKRSNEPVPFDFVKRIKSEDGNQYQCNFPGCDFDKKWKTRDSVKKHIQRLHQRGSSEEGNKPSSEDTQKNFQFTHNEAFDSFPSSPKKLGQEIEIVDSESSGSEDESEYEDPVDHLDENLGDLPEDCESSTPFSKRNSPEILADKLKQLTELRENHPPVLEAEMWFRKICLLHRIPSGVAEELIENSSKLALLQGKSIPTIDRDLGKTLPDLGFPKTLKSGTKIRYLPLTTSLLLRKERNPPGPYKVIIYWDGFRRFRAKGGTTGKFIFWKRKNGMKKKVKDSFFPIKSQEDFTMPSKRKRMSQSEKKILI